MVQTGAPVVQLAAPFTHVGVPTLLQLADVLQLELKPPLALLVPPPEPGSFQLPVQLPGLDVITVCEIPQIGVLPVGQLIVVDALEVPVANS